MSTIDWGFSWQPNQEIMFRLASAGNKVLFVESTAARKVRLSDWRRVLGRARSALGRRPLRQRTHPNLRIYSPLVLPFPHFSPAHRLNTGIVFRELDRWIHAHLGREIIFWAFLASPLTLALIERLRPECVIYQCMGDVTASRPLAAIAEAERALIRRSDLVFANSLSLLKHVRAYTARGHLFRAAVDVEAFQRAAQVAARPADIAHVSNPIAGYVGSIHDWIDFELLARVATALPAWQFVMVGPVLREPGRLRGIPNVHWLGQRPHQDLPAYIRHFDVCLIPYVLDRYTASTYPGKLNEYLALGKPVVATPLPELRAYNEEFGDVIALAAGPDEFARAIERSHAHVDDDRRAQFIAAARANSWTSVLEHMSHLVEEALGRSGLRQAT